MIKEKITALIKTDNKNNKKKIENLIFAFIVLVITLISINIIFKGDKKKETTNSIQIGQTNSTSEVEINTNIEERLENILNKIKGIEDVTVLITYSETEKLVPVYNESSSQSTTQEQDTEGGTRTIQSYDVNKEVISDAEQNPITEKVILPKIEGAVITAKGAGNTTAKENIINAVQAATGLATHKIQVFETQN